jgi:hypothetical protein
MITLTNTTPTSKIIVIDAEQLLNNKSLSASVLNNLKTKKVDQLKVFTTINEAGHEMIIAPFSKNATKDDNANLEIIRSLGNAAFKYALEAQLKEISIQSELSDKQTFAFVEGFALSNYKFDKYKSKATPLINQIFVSSENFTQASVDTLNQHYQKCVLR